MYSSMFYAHTMHFWSAIEDGKVTCRTGFGGEKAGVHENGVADPADVPQTRMLCITCIARTCSA